MDSITLTRPDDWHLHLRDGAALAAVLPDTVRRFARAIVMPNLKPPVTTVALAAAYRERILAALPAGSAFQPLMTLYLTDNTVPAEIDAAKACGFVHGVKLYPAGATTNSDAGVSDLKRCTPTLERMQALGMPLLVHGEVTDPAVDVFDREAVFIDTVLLPLLRDFPALKLVLEHITTKDGIDFVNAGGAHVAGTLTAHHLLLNRNAIFAGGIRPHHYCLPVLKREAHRQALVAAAISGNPKFFLGTDSAPHAQSTKEAPAAAPVATRRMPASNCMPRYSMPPARWTNSKPSPASTARISTVCRATRQHHAEARGAGGAGQPRLPAGRPAGAAARGGDASPGGWFDRRGVSADFRAA
jgi:dihydroorotase